MELTVGELLAYIKRYNIPTDSKVFVERIEDLYFKPNSSWLECVVKKDNEHSTDPKFPKEIADEFKDQYIPAAQIPHYAIDGDLNLYISVHY